MRPLVFGIETEYASFSTKDHSPEAVANMVYEGLRRYPHLMAGDRGIYTVQGGRVYLDIGAHLEIASPEVTDPWSVAAYDKAADRLVAKELEDASGSAYVVKNNISYLGATYGSHESYLLDSDHLDHLDQPMIGFLASRVIFCGAGRLSFNPQGCGYEISQRASQIVCRTGDKTTHQRALFSTRNEPLSRYGRLHLIAGDGLMSETGTVLRFGTTALVVRMAELGRLESTPTLLNPVFALHRFSLDPACRVRVGGQTAVGLQRWYQNRAVEFLRHSECPPWAAQVVALWGQILDSLEKGPQLLSQTLDWQIKYAILHQRIAQVGLTWPELRDWGHVAFELLIPNLKKRVDLKGNEQSTREIFKEVLEDQVFCKAEAFLSQKKMAWRDLYSRYKAIASLCEVCVRYSDVGPGGIFNQLARKGLLRHQLLREEEVLRAMKFPPTNTRAKLRSMAVIEHWSTEGAMADWTRVWAGGKVLDLSDPFESTRMEWVSRENSTSELGRRVRAGLRRFLEDESAESVST